MTRINRKCKDERDFFVTPRQMCISLANKYNIVGDRVLDPCCGLGNMKNYLPITNQYDLYPQIDVQKKDFLTETERWDCIIMNPPYRDKYKFINKAIELSDRVFILMPLEVSSYNIFVKDYLNTGKYKGRLLMTPKVFMSPKDEFITGGTTVYCWYEFAANSSDIKYEIYDDLREITV